MRILIDLQGCQSGSRFGGIGRYSMSLAKAMLRLETKHEFYFLLNSRLSNENFIRAEFASLMPQRNILTFNVPAYVAAENELPAHTQLAELIREKRIAEIDPDVLHIASLFEGAGEDVVTSIGMLFPSERTAVTLYDLIPYLEQETYLTSPMLADHYLRKFEALTRAGMVVSISDFSRAEALEHTSIPSERIANISSAVDGQFSLIEVESQARIDLLGKFNIEKPFLMFAGSFDARKNHGRLVKAFAMLSPGLRQQYQLVIIGKGEDRQLAKLKEVAREHGLNGSDIVFVGHVTDAELVALYNLCALFVFPSLREGFGLPVLEAMSCGAPTIGSNRTSIPEVINRPDALFDPEDVDDIAEKITSVLGNPAFRAELRQHGLERAKQFSWALSAKRALDFFERRIEGLRGSGSMSNQPSRTQSEATENSAAYAEFLAVFSKHRPEKLDEELLESAARTIAANELLAHIEAEEYHVDMRIGWVTKWADGSAIANYSQRIISVLPLRPVIFAPYSAITPSADCADVIRCWTCGEADNLSVLRDALASAAVDTVVIQYQSGEFNLSVLADFITQQKSVDRSVFVTLHSTADLQVLTAETGMLEVRKALKSCDGLFVHSMNDVKNLETFKVRKNVFFVPNLDSKNQFDKSAGGEHARVIADYLMRKMAFAIATGGHV